MVCQISRICVDISLTKAVISVPFPISFSVSLLSFPIPIQMTICDRTIFTVIVNGSWALGSRVINIILRERKNGVKTFFKTMNKYAHIEHQSKYRDAFLGWILKNVPDQFPREVLECYCVVTS